MQKHVDPIAPKITTRLSIDSDLFHEAEKRQINLSQTLESHLAELLGEATPKRQQDSLDGLEELPVSRGVTCLFTNGWSNF